MEPALIALIGTLFGGVGVKMAESLISKSRHKTDVATQIRSELWNEVAALRKELSEVHRELDAWKTKYYTTIEDLIRVKSELEHYVADARSSIDIAETHVQDIPED